MTSRSAREDEITEVNVLPTEKAIDFRLEKILSSLKEGSEHRGVICSIIKEKENFPLYVTKDFIAEAKPLTKERKPARINKGTRDPKENLRSN